GNLRELRNVVHQSFIVADRDLELDALEEAAVAFGKGCTSSLLMAVGTPLADAERQLILATLAQFAGDKHKVAAATLCLSPANWARVARMSCRSASASGVPTAMRRLEVQPLPKATAASSRASSSRSRSATMNDWWTTFLSSRRLP